MSIEFPSKMQALFRPKRFKIFWGGRGASRSWSFARALLLKGTQQPLRVLCAREFQNSIEESVHKVISDQIRLLGLEQVYRIEKAHIYGPAGTVFSFEGIKNNVNRIRSYEGIDVCWVEEAVKVTRNSWNVLIPTIRKPGSEIWMSFNPELEDDYTYEIYVKEVEREGVKLGDGMFESERCVSIKMTWADNPWFPEVLQGELAASKRRGELPGHEQDYADYLNVWEGHCLQMIHGAVFAREMLRAQEEGRICSVPWERAWPVDTFWDLGRADQTVVWFAQRVAMQFRVLACYSASGEHIGHFTRELQNREFIYGTHHLPHDAKAKRLGSKRTIEEMVRQSFPNCSVRIVPKLSIVDGINAARTILPNCWFDEEDCENGIKGLKHYRYNVVNGQLSNEPLHDWASDYADAFRYLAVSMRPEGRKVGSGVGEKLERLQESSRKRSLDLGGLRGAASSALGWMGL